MLRLVEGEPGLWERFQKEAAVAHEPAVFTRWQRARDLGVVADGGAHPMGVSNQDLAARRDAALDGLRDGNAVIEALEANVTSRGLLSILTDADGVIVRARGGSLFEDDVRNTRLVEGARWDEGARGTNAIGTAIAESQPVAVVGRAHFENVNHGLFCYAAPVRDAFGERVAVLDVSGPLAFDHSEVGAIVRGAAAELEEALRVHAYARTEGCSRGFLERMVDRSAAPAVLLEAPGVVRKMNGRAAAELDGRSTHTVERLFGIGWAELVREAAHGSAVFETRRRKFRVEFEAIHGSLGRTLAIVCFLTSEAPKGRARVTPAQAQGPLPDSFAPIVAHDAHVVAAKHTAARLAPSDLPVMLLAETGTGKELFAHAIHRASKRASAPFVALNCGALTSTVLDSELFGYAPASFTGASRAGAEGKLAAAHRGTLFLDEVADMPASAQAMLLRFLEDGTYTRIGESATRKADVRLVCATCRDLPKLVEQGTFRSDLFFRIQGGCVRLPPVRERTDRLELARALVKACAEAQKRPSAPELGPSAEAWVLDHGWPGNVRELKTSILHALAMCSGGVIGVEHFSEPLVTAGAHEREAGCAPPSSSRREALKRMADDAIARAGGNMSAAARALGVARSTLYRMLDTP